MALEHRTVATNGVNLHCAVDGDGPLVVLLHGFPECWYSWRHQIAALAPRFRAVAPDLRGYNLSDKPAGVAAYALPELDRKSTRLNSSHSQISYAVFCLKKKK